MQSYRKRYGIKIKNSVIIFTIFAMFILLLSAGFSSLSTSLNMSAMAIVRPQKDIRVTAVSSSNTTLSGSSNEEEYDVRSIITSVSLPNADSTITYDVTVTNIGNVEMGILSISGLPNNLTYSISNYNLKDVLCDDNDNTKCKLGSETTLHITIGYANNGYNSNSINYNFQMDFEFKEVYSISYIGFTNVANLPKTILKDETKTITFNNSTDIPLDVSTNNATGNYTNPTLTLSNAVGNVTITRYYSVTYNDFTGNTSGLISKVGPQGATITFNSTTGVPEYVLVTGALSNYNPDTHELVLTEVTSNVNITMTYDGDVKITSISRYDVSNVIENTNAKVTNDGQNVTFDLGVVVDESNHDQDFYITYEIVVENDSVYEQKVLATNFTPNIVGEGNVPIVSYNIKDVNGNQILNTLIAPKTSETYYLTIIMEPQEHGNWSVDGETSVDTVENGTVSGSILDSNQGDLTGSNDTAHFVAKIANSYEEAKTFILSINDDKFKIVDSDGNDISNMSIGANSTGNYDFYIKNLNGNSFVSSPYNLNVNINYDSTISSIGAVSLLVDIDPTLSDNTAPVISNLSATQTSAQKEILVSWSGTDDNSIVNYYVETYTSDASGNGTLYHTETLSGAPNGTQVNYTATVPNDNAYYFFKVYGIDQSNNKATAAEIASCSTSNGHCSMTSNTIYKWNFVVTLVLTNATSSQGSVSTNGSRRTYTINATYDSNVTTTLSGSGNDYNAPSSISSATITYPNGNSENLSNGNSSQTAYNYNNSSGSLNVYHIKGDIRIVAEGSEGGTCLAEGTKILLANGTYKNIEDIGYDDLLSVWNYDTGKLTSEYPLWIEKKQSSNVITKVTFSDNSYINFVGNHSIYDMDRNIFINISNYNDFKVGINVAKIKNDRLVSVSIKKIERINKTVNYYFVGSTTYYNIFANDVLTTDRNLMISNLYGFDDNATWPKEKAKLLEDDNNLLDYSDFEDVLPYYLYSGFRVREAGYLVNNKMISLDVFKEYISTLIINPEMLEEPITIDNSRYWMVTTSEDNINNLNKKMFLRKESSTYILPKSNSSNFVGWYNTSNNSIYKPGDKIFVAHGIHFEAIYDINKVKDLELHLFEKMSLDLETNL